jgi:hypothetical protein
MYAIIKRDDNVAYNVNEYMCDNMSDLDSLPRCAPGSTAIVLEDGNTMVFMKNTEGKWVKL